MANTSIKVSGLPTASNVASTDRFVILYNAVANAIIANGSPSVRTVNVSTVYSSLVLTNITPANSTANGTQGTIVYDTNYLYICVANNTWKRLAYSANTW